MKKIVVSNSLGRLKNGRKLVLFPSRWTSAVKSKSRPFCFYPYELAYLSSLLKEQLPQNEYAVKMIDPNVLGLNQKETIDYLESLHPDYLIFEPSAIDSDEILEILRHFKLCRDTIGIVVGAYAKAEPVLCQQKVDFVIPGEYEFTVLEVIQAGLRSANGCEIPGVHPNPRRTDIDPDDLPWPDDEDICRLDYTEPGCDGQMIQVYASRGCPLACTFCVVPSYYRDRSNSWRRRNPRDVALEIQYLDEKYRGMFEGIFFNEEAHNTSKEWMIELCHELINHKLTHLKYDAMCVYFNFDEELFSVMRGAGYHQIRFGIESFEDEVGRNIRKNVKFNKLKSMLELARSHGFVTYGTSMVGAQGSTFQSDLQTHNLLCHLRDELKLLNKWQVSIATPQPGTPFYEWAKKSGYLLTDDLSVYNGRQAVINYPHYPADAIETMYDILVSKRPISLAKAQSMLTAKRREQRRQRLCSQAL